MKLLLLLLTILCVHFSAMPQAGDFVLVQKNGRTVKNFFKGANVRFATVGGKWYDARIEKISNDSIFFKEVIIQQVGTSFGVARLDTMTTYMQKVHYRDIVAIPRRKESFSYVKNGTLFMLGGAGYAALNLINSASQAYAPFGRDNLPLLGTAAGVFLVGKVLKKTHRYYLPIGKKYTLRYIRA